MRRRQPRGRAQAGRPQASSSRPRARALLRRETRPQEGRRFSRRRQRLRSSIWHSIYAFPPTSQAYWDAGYADFAKRFGPILEEFDKANVNFGLEVHPTEIAFDIASSERAIAAVRGHRRFGFNYDPSHLGYQGVDYVKFIRAFGSRIYHCHMKDVWWGHGDGTVGVFGGHVSFGHPSRYWDFRSLGHGDINFEEIIVALNDVGYRGRSVSVGGQPHGSRAWRGGANAFVQIDFPLERDRVRRAVRKKG